ncbi:hypothetical protein RRG08_049194, partial [Elysia crispata]
GNEVTLADIFVYDFISRLDSRDSSLVNFENFSHVKEHQNKIGSLPRIKAYLESRKPSEM